MKNKVCVCVFRVLCLHAYSKYQTHRGEKTPKWLVCFGVEGVNWNRDRGLLEHVKTLITHREPWVLLRRRRFWFEVWPFAVCEKAACSLTACYSCSPATSLPFTRQTAHRPASQPPSFPPPCLPTLMNATVKQSWAWNAELWLCCSNISWQIAMS